MHHCFARSLYAWPDRNEPWNLVNLCRKCHDRLHVQAELQRKYEALAFTRRPKDRHIHRVMIPYHRS